MFHNKIGNKDVALLVQALLQNNTVKYINLDQNQIGNKGAMSIAELLQGNNSIKRIDLHHNKIGNKGAQHLVQALEKNNCLLILELSKNNIDQGLQKDIIKLLRRNASKTVQTLPDENYQGDQAQEDNIWQWLEKKNTTPISPKIQSQSQVGTLDERLHSIAQKLKEIQQQLCMIIEEIEMPTQHHLLQEQSSQSSLLLGNTSLIDSSDSTDHLHYLTYS